MSARLRKYPGDFVALFNLGAALQAEGKQDEALVHLWNAIEPARLAADEQALLEIVILAQGLPEKDAADLIAATGLVTVSVYVALMTAWFRLRRASGAVP